MTSEELRRCEACGSTIVGQNQIAVRTVSNPPDGNDAVTLLLCEPCEFGVLNELHSRYDRTENTEEVANDDG